MRQLIHASDSHVIVGLGDVAFVARSVETDKANITQLLPPSSAASLTATNDTATTTTVEDTISFGEIQAVAVAEFEDKVWCAVARYDKSLALYRIDDNQERLSPTTVHSTHKRSSCLTFAKVPGDSEFLNVAIAGDLAGDAVAFSLTKDATTPDDDQDDKDENDAEQPMQECTCHQRLLLGHTASMLTGVTIVNDATHARILTSDRDEKIRVSHFPNSHVIQGFLLGHEAFVTSLDANNNSSCATSSGDGTIRLWDYETCEEIAMTSVATNDQDEQRLPTRVALSPAGDSVVVIYNAPCTDMDVFMLSKDGTTKELKRTARVTCAAQPLGLTRLPGSNYDDKSMTVLVLMQEPVYIQAYKICSDGSNIQAIDLPFCIALRSLAATTLKESSVSLPESILERDKFGNLKMQKLEETRGPSKNRPWNNADRKEKARQRNKRSKKRRKHNKQHESST